jgi:hypothetical protein
MQSRNNNCESAMIERVVAALSYLTMGAVGFIWLLVAAFTRNSLRPFIKYHIFQSLFISILYFLICVLVGMLMDVLSFIPFIGQILLQFMIYLNMPLLFGFSLIEFFITIFVLYLVWTSFLGEMSYVPWISDIIKVNVDRS